MDPTANYAEMSPQLKASFGGMSKAELGGPGTKGADLALGGL